MKIAFIIFSLILSGCGGGGTKVKDSCTSYPASYVVRYPDGVSRKSGLESCGPLFKVTSLTGDGVRFEAEILMIRSQDGSGYYYSSFSGG